MVPIRAKVGRSCHSQRSQPRIWRTANQSNQ